MQKNSSQTTHQEQSDRIPGSVAFYFYSMLAFSFALPVIVALGVIFVRIPVQVMLWIAVLLFLGGVAIVYVKIFRQMRELQNFVEHLNEIETDTEINFLGGLFRIRIEQTSKKALPPPAKNNGGYVKRAEVAAVFSNPWPESILQSSRGNGRSNGDSSPCKPNNSNGKNDSENETLEKSARHENVILLGHSKEVSD